MLKTGFRLRCGPPNIYKFHEVSGVKP